MTTLTTGKDGKATAKNLPLGQYRVVEVEAPYGYVLNPNEQKVTFTYVDDKTPVIKESLTFSDDRQKLDMSVTKLDAEDNTPIAGAVFGLYADEDIKNVAGKVIIEKGTLLEKATSDENGKIAFVKDYPFAKYVARELVKPAGYVTNEEAVNFDTKYQGQDVKAAVYNSEYKNTPTTFEFTKTDITSGAELTGATLTVLDKDGNVVDTWTSDAKEAHVIKKLVVGEMDCQHFFRQIFLGYFSDIVQAFDTLRKNVCGDDYTSLHNPIVLSSVLPAYGMFHSIQILFL